MKRILIVITTALIAMQCYAQDIEVAEFRQLETDLTANTAGTIVLDRDGEKCALIKVSTSKSDFLFDAGTVGVVKTIPKEGEIWVYVPEGVKRLTISRDGMETLRDHDLGISVKKACTYLLVLKTSKDIILQTVNFEVSPANASVVLESADNNSEFASQTVALEDGASALKIPVGNYRYTASLTGYNAESGTFELTSSGVKNIIIRMTSADGATSASVVSQQSTPLKDSAPSFHPVEDETITVKGVSFKMIGVQGGTFKMGSASGEPNENPVHEVTLSSYHIGETEVTQQLWEAVMGSNPSKYNKNPQNPVEKVSWNDCKTFISKLNSLTGKQFRMPTEAEWEFAARGGNKSQGYAYSGSSNAKKIACFGKMLGGPEPVKSKSPNELGIYDMSGNVWEWCNDFYGDYRSASAINPTGPKSSPSRILRGGSWGNSASSSSVSFRVGQLPKYLNDNIGLRLAF